MPSLALQVEHRPEVMEPTVLIVDDNESIRRGLARLLRCVGLNSVVASDGLEALNMIEQQRLDLVLLDISMPGMDGMTVLETLRASERYASLPVVMYSAVEDEALKRRAARLGADFFRKGTASWDELETHIRSRLAMAAVAHHHNGWHASHIKA
jgi:two-component system, chemotaxis family, chemotaxis protein CheY